MKVIKRLLLLLVPTATVLGALALGSVGSAPASTTPEWYINGSHTFEPESLGGFAQPSTMSVAGVTTKCEESYYLGKIFNEGGAGHGSLTYLPLYNCSANDGCTLAKIEPTKLPWTMHTVYGEGTKTYVVIEGVSIEASYTGEKCPIKGTSTITGSIGGAFENKAQTTVFNSASAKATGSALKASGATVEFGGTYSIEAVGPAHHGELVEVK